MIDLPLIDSDSHVTEPSDLWTSRLPSRWADIAPRVEWNDATGQLEWRVVDEWVHDIGKHSLAGWDGYPPGSPKRYEDIDPAAFDPKARLERMDEYGIFAQVLYPNLLAFTTSFFRAAPDPRYAIDCVRAYNDFLTEFAEADPARLVPIMVLPFWDLEESVREFHRAADLGHKGVLLAAHFEKAGLPDLWDPHWEPLLKAIEERGMSINFHVGFSTMSVEEYKFFMRSPADLHAAKNAVTLLGNARAIADIVCNGLCHRYPGIDFVSVESGASWVPWLLEALDWQWQAFGAVKLRPERELPSFYVRRQVYGSYWFERESLQSMIHLLPDNIMFETDFPHPTSLSPGPASIAGRPIDMAMASLEGVPEDIVRKVLYGTAARLYGLDVPLA